MVASMRSQVSREATGGAAPGRVSRRTLLRRATTATLALGGTALLAACSSATTTSASSSGTTSAASAVTSFAVTSASPAATTTKAATASAAGSKATTTSTVTSSAAVSTAPAAASAVTSSAVALPKNVPAYIPIAGGKPDLPGTSSGVPPGYLKLPAPFSSYNGVPGQGGAVTFFVIVYGVTPNPMNSNPDWQQVNKALGVTWQPTFVPAGSYPEKLAAMIASGDIPDLVVFPASVPVPNLAQLLDHDFVDLTPYLAGDAARGYPNLANIPTYAWKNSLVANKIYGIPIARSVVGTGLFYRDDWTKAAGIAQVKSADDFFNLMKALTNAKSQRWGMASSTDSTFNMSFFLEMFGAPNGWRRESNGTLTNQVEAPEFADAIAFIHKIYAAGYTYPDTANLNIQQAKALFAASKFGCYSDGITAAPQLWVNFKAANSSNTYSLLPPFAHDGGKPTYFFSSGYYGFTAVSKKAQPRIKEMLNILDYGSAPLGSNEWRLLNFGVKGRDWNPGPNGAPVVTKTLQADGGNLMNYAGSPPFTLYDAQYSEPTQIEWNFCKTSVPLGIYDPTLGLYSATQAAKGASLTKLIQNHVIAMVTGRSPLSDVKTLISDWKSQGGDQVRKEYEAALGAK